MKNRPIVDLGPFQPHHRIKQLWVYLACTKSKIRARKVGNTRAIETYPIRTVLSLGPSAKALHDNQKESVGQEMEQKVLPEEVMPVGLIRVHPGLIFEGKL